MVESSSHNPSSPKITPKEDPVTLNNLESPNPFLPTDQVEFSFDETFLTTNNEVALLYLSHLNSEYFKIVSYFISKCCLKEAFTRAPTQYKEYLCEFCFFHLHSESASGHDASVDSTAEADLRNSALNNSIPAQQDQTKSVGDGLKTAHTNSDINQLTNLLVTSLKPEFSKLLVSHDFASCLPNALKELPSKFTELSGEIKELKKHVQDMEIELPGDLKEIPTKLETFTSIISSLSSQVVELKNIQWELPVEFATVVENASGATTKGVPSVGQATTSPAEGEKNTNPATTDAEPNLHDELVDLLGIDIVTQYYNKKLLYDKYCDKMLKRRKSSKIINCDVLTQKGPITLQVYMEDRTVEVISNVKVSDLHLAEWKEAVQACPDRKEKGWKTIYGLIKTRMEYLDQTEKELKIDFNKPLKEQDPLNELN
ncbi:hypothetical protein Tco_1256961, partial [Tanacetum coccineum]